MNRNHDARGRFASGSGGGKSSGSPAQRLAKAERTITLYHRTSPEAADSIQSQGEFKPGWQGAAYFSTRKSEGKQYGSATVSIQIPHSEYNKNFNTRPNLNGSSIAWVSPGYLKYLGVKPKRIK